MRFCLIFVLFLCNFAALAGNTDGASGGGRIKSAFGSNCDELLIEQINGAETEILVAIYSFTHQRIARALAEASKRGATVKVKYDEGQADWIGMKEALKILKDAGIDCKAIKMSEEHAGMHHKFTVIDGSKVLTGSFNYTSAGDKRNYENLVLISSKPIAEAYKKEFESIRSR